ncbi:transcriptional regulator, LysR family [Tistlia consotensis]|uniref:Transcriptional regulator, LysR family n=1 Tax=Tistlia consotensis USBA 355 TaxID=560819 RepID=A0A1Y6BQ51_9PROT|nr:LysR family transcriptional regulator [Tistlia consotensis]SMF14674.1 transcriptional regulator, LysR family [Tistlia consotensis USBA 355]SNR49340.1 transcriptional regulator, LysR family [Tistlia consotensis]
MASLQQLRAFLTVAETGSFVAASGRIGLSQPALSLSIKALEEEVGGRLLDRSSRRVALTSEGRQFRPVAARLVEDWHAAFDDIRSLFRMERGRVSLAVLPSVAVGLLPRVAPDFTARYPNVDIEVFDVIAERVAELVRSGRVDFGCSVEPRERAGLAFEPLLHERFLVVHRPDHPLAAAGRATAADLAGHPFIALSRASSVRRAVDAALEPSGRRIRPLFEVEQISTAAILIASGQGLTAVPASCMALMRPHGLVGTPLVEPEVDRVVGLLRREGASLSVAAATLAARFRAAFAAVGQGGEAGGEAGEGAGDGAEASDIR